MGRYTTGAITVNRCLQLNVNTFIKVLPKEFTCFNGTTTWTTGSTISFTITKNNFGLSLVLDYTKTVEGEKKDINYSIQIEKLPSNLGEGQIYYFICPFSLERCRILYMGYGSLFFKSRKAYRHRLYYPSQLSSNLDKHNDIYWILERRLEKLYIKHPKTHYKGIITKPQQRIERLEQKMQFHDERRWNILPKSLMKVMGLR